MGSKTKFISVLGATGSIGVNALNVVRSYPDLYRLKYLSAHSQADLLIEQALEFSPSAVSIGDADQYDKVKNALPGVEVLKGRAGLLELAARDDVDTMLNGLVGSAGMEPTIKSIQAGVDIALSNKESLVMAGDFINGLLKEHKVNLYPVDSEHSAIWQCLTGESSQDIKRLIVTGSGGPFRTLPAESFDNITVAQALKHPNWAMGRKITIDSATMMNKGLEVIEARWLFHLPAEKIDIVVHPQSIIHSMVEFLDGSVKAQLGIPDMKIPIQYALSYPRHLKQDWEQLDLAKIGTLTFEEPDLKKFKCIQLAFDALEQGGSVPVVLNVANEEAVYRFLDGEISFNAIPELIIKAIDAHDFLEHPNLDDILALEQWTQAFMKRS
ncbi:MAG: 1-deoxy-D-xylulose-5-phosphate reductoisomerase [Candidatus Marinimicrobia bacterium]|jgi:1-deoxy-D-xylulose-5-phosphate reductoisomerase|nr:1-deoxy-D-xylulose-5-phosphate reductoisomerase [Candidatus Neomarinimicrobiota bacterium]MBT3632059.1 1-deoxy-D-xylulose-5-phosphate reductoisomerase [Candidatus Neomarinimicrobiota bacterium]MBT3824645.1 1-deoxy-D-xylulose-5-phosphate reductoisomerase [Candidatus Neomarinimicrobiota bacterium]MBT4130181.1 1-deoxy-D-xylulose-5-phosphate reductoisomerase [Candidatus Neomarinimicrobiota bacterium]MBT4296931.1 1-deoxy-D-xylulose-5-phosphate reductoisomerase [Candidatus Neomarinimicrobiota bact